MAASVLIHDREVGNLVWVEGTQVPEGGGCRRGS